MPVKKGSVAYEARLARRRAQRKIKNLEKQLRDAGIGTRNSINIQAQINKIKDYITGTYQKVKGKTVRSANQVQANLKQLEVITPSVSTQRRNILAMYEISHAYEGFIGPRTRNYSEGEMHVFFAATIRAWQGLPKEQRGRAIMEYYNVSDLTAFIDKVIKENRLAIDIYNGKVMLDELSSESEELYQESAARDTADSEKYDSLYMSYLVEATRAESVVL